MKNALSALVDCAVSFVTRYNPLIRSRLWNRVAK